MFCTYLLQLPVPRCGTGRGCTTSPTNIAVSHCRLTASRRDGLANAGCCLHQQLQRRLGRSQRLCGRGRSRAGSKAMVGGGGASGDEDQPSVDIDELARRLSAEAGKRRRENFGEEAARAGSDSGRGDDAAQEDATPSLRDGLAAFGIESSSSSQVSEADVLDQVGDGGFCASEFELLQQLGRISVQRVKQDEQASAAAGGLPLRTSSTEAAVVAFLARYTSGRPYERPAAAFLKEFLPGAKSLALNELQVYSRLLSREGGGGGLPQAKWRAATGPSNPDVPIVPLLGYFIAGPSDVATAPEVAAADPPTGSDDSSSSTLWLVYKWDGLLPLSAYPRVPQEGAAPPALLPWVQRPGPEQLARRMLRRIAAGVLRCLAFCHSRGVVHGSIGPSSFLLSTFDNSAAAQLDVRLADFGFARFSSATRGGDGNGKAPALGPSPQPLLSHEDDPVALGQSDDLRAACLVLMEAACCSLAVGGPDGPEAQAMSGAALQRLAAEVFVWDMGRLREHCLEEPGLEAAVALLDARDGAGWDLMRALAEGTPAEVLLPHPFLLLEGEEG